MDTVNLIVLALIQALTEFLPISSSAHLALAGFFLNWEYQGLIIDLSLHFGTLLAVCIYFRDDIRTLGCALWQIRSYKTQLLTSDQRIAIGIIIATVPAAVVGLLLGDHGALLLRHPVIIASCMAGFAVLLGWADRQPEQRDISSLTIRDALLIGFLQCLALVPGTSRSGITMTAARVQGLTRAAAARYSFLLSIPITFLASAHGLLEVILHPGPITWLTFCLGAFLSALFGLIVIHFFLRYIPKIGLLPFVIYRLIFAVVILIVFYKSTLYS